MSTHVPKRRHRISVAMIVRDAEQAVVSSLKSVQDIADEIVVADTGSTDGTMSAASSLATRVIEVPWQNNFSAARNACMAATTGEWILWLDAGEVLEEQSAQRLLSFLNSSADTGTVYRLQVQRPAANGTFSGMQIAQHRLVPCNRDLKFRGCVAESLDESIASLELHSEMLDLAILRPLEDHENDIRLEKARRNLRIVELELENSPDDLRLLLVQAESLAELGEHAEARSLFQQVRQQSKHG
ncbi:MAG: glycosyltransferase, partial [Planctomycetales bacterium]